MSPSDIVRVEPPPSMGAPDAELLERAQDVLGRVYVPGRHEVASALRTADGTVHTGVHVDGSARRSAICAEGVAMGTAAGALHGGAGLDIEAVVSVLVKPAGRFRVIAPCGVCRELISDYCPDARVWVSAGDDVVAYRAIELLPEKTRRTW
ncbi:hypothetical protein KIH74_26040 [Kineosporia sp. J2-2]|uniref:CMP/dCMP-type deaminase domain-containing protein n=1 Tax=Kineosporia corallincola TaxID=2835133 RepID=A0ABS5TNN3_9ACTN|nr:hypothetical protein [Kineosporia corallincola]MBT0772433.1 hypothetical protein [Kineosporia corallincola]